MYIDCGGHQLLNVQFSLRSLAHPTTYSVRVLILSFSWQYNSCETEMFLNRFFFHSSVRSPVCRCCQLFFGFSFVLHIRTCHCCVATRSDSDQFLINYYYYSLLLDEHITAIINKMSKSFRRFSHRTNHNWKRKFSMASAKNIQIASASTHAHLLCDISLQFSSA